MVILGILSYIFITTPDIMIDDYQNPSGLAPFQPNIFSNHRLCRPLIYKYSSNNVRKAVITSIIRIDIAQTVEVKHSTPLFSVDMQTENARSNSSSRASTEGTIRSCHQRAPDNTHVIITK